MARYRVKNLRNPDGIRVGQTWYAKLPTSSPLGELKIDAVFGTDLFAITKTGEEVRLSSNFLTQNFTVTKQGDIFGGKS